MNNNNSTNPIQVDVIRSNQRDEFFIDLLQSELQKSLSHLLGHDFVIKWSSEIMLLGDFLYFYLTTSRKGRTLGEEYIGSVAVVKGRSRISGQRRLMSILLRVLPLYVFNRIYMSRRIRNNHKDLFSFLSTIQEVLIPCLFKINLTYFFIFGGPFRLAERISGIKLKFLSPTDRPQRSRHIILATILTIHIAFSLYSNRYRIIPQQTRDNVSSVIRRISSLWGNSNNGGNSYANNLNTTIGSAMISEKADAPQRRGILSYFGLGAGASQDTNTGRKVTGVFGVECQICRCAAEHPSCGPCGHIMCWECLAEWVVLHGACPMCRSPCLPQQLVRVHHYDGS